jgi:hypothetical protein
MSKSSRRRFLARAAALPAAALLADGQAAHGQATVPRSDITAESTTLRALADVVLPTGELDERDIGRALQGFARWVEGIEPVAELDHPYLSTDEIAYGPPDPRPAWRAQVEALELLARRRHETGFASLGRAERERLLREQLPKDLPRSLPHPAAALHVAVALLSWFYASDEANDLCYRARIGRHECRGLPSARERPAPLEGSPWNALPAGELAE